MCNKFFNLSTCIIIIIIMSKNDWKADGYTWTNQGTKCLPRKDPKYKKSYFYIKDKDGRPNAGFRKDVFFPTAQETGQSTCIVHYIGNE